VTLAISSRFHDAMGLMAQHIVTTSGCSEPSLAWNAHLHTRIPVTRCGQEKGARLGTHTADYGLNTTCKCARFSGSGLVRWGVGPIPVLDVVEAKVDGVGAREERHQGALLQLLGCGAEAGFNG
jgi:hypothetical protein